jgi:hypothetical protein
MYVFNGEEKIVNLCRSSLLVFRVQNKRKYVKFNFKISKC